MSRELAVRNRQRVRRIHVPLLRRILNALLTRLAAARDHELCVHLVAAPEMTRLNESFLRHDGSTDVMTFDYSTGAVAPPSPTRRGGASCRDGARARRAGRGIGWEKAGVRVHGEVFICVDEAITQARRFRTTWQSELVRYAIHGLLHLLGHDDRHPAARRRMKREENRLLRELSLLFPIRNVARRRPTPRQS